MSETSSDLYWIPACEAEAELTIKKSRFIGHVRVVATEDEARAAVKEIARSDPSANHHCWAYRVGSPFVREYFSDAGEPSGTAGKPILGAIHRQDVTNTVVVVTRHFGGIKLGVRGLIEAYGKSATAALNEAGRKQEQLHRNLQARITYEGQRPLFYQFQLLGIAEDDIQTEYGASVEIGLAVPLSRVEEVQDLFHGYFHKGWVLEWNWVEEEPSGS